MSLVVVGTDTEIGKTVVSAVLLARYAEEHRLAYWKPVATGGSGVDCDRSRVEAWVGHAVDILPETYVYDPPVSPHLAARQAGRRIEPEIILGDLVRHAMEDEERCLVVEGVGGVLVPFREDGYLLIDLLRDMHLPCVLVARSTLGTINHTLLSLEALRSRNLEVAGVVLSGPPDRENRAAIEKFGKIGVIAEVDRQPELNREAIARMAESFDQEAILKKYFE